MIPSAPAFSVVVPTRGDAALAGVIADLSAQSLPRDRFEVVVAFDGVAPSADQQRRMDAAGVTIAQLDRRRGPGAARNAGAAVARGTWLAFTEDDVRVPAGWLAHAAARLAAEPSLEVLEGRTAKPGGRTVRVRGDDRFLYLPTNLFVRRALYARVGGYDEHYFDGDVYFREDADFGFTLEEAGATVARDDTLVVLHPDEHPRAGDTLRWARRYVMDARLARRHPVRFRTRIEVHRVGPLRVRRPFVRACGTYVAALALAVVAAGLGARTLAWVFVGVALAALLIVWAKWHFDLRRLVVVPVVPFVLVAALIRGWRRG